MFSLSNNLISSKWRLSYLVFALITALTYDFFFWNVSNFGFGFVLFVFIYIGGFTLLSFVNKQLYQPKALWLLVPIFIFTLDILFYNNNFVRTFVSLFVAILFFAYSFLLTLRNPEKIKFDFLRLIFFVNLREFFGKFKEISTDLDFSKKNKNSDLYKKILLGIIISLPILFIFVNLFISADSIFATKIFNLFDFHVEPDIVYRIFRTIFLTFVLAGFFYLLIDPLRKIEHKNKKSIKIDKTVAMVILTLVNLLFFTFVIIQLQYLFGSTDFVVTRGLVFSDYAKQGFFQLAWVIVLSSIILIVFYRSASEYGSNTALKLLKIFLILQVGVIAMSALKRMNLYQDAYGFTTMRLYVEWFVYFCISILTFTAVSLSIEFEFRKFFNTTAVIGVIVLSLVSSINVDSMIAKRNIDRYLNEGEKIDVYYLTTLSSDALEQIMRLDSKIDGQNLSQNTNLNYYMDYSENNNVTINNPSKYIIGSWKDRYDYNSWKGFNFSLEKLWKIED